MGKDKVPGVLHHLQRGGVAVSVGWCVSAPQQTPLSWMLLPEATGEHIHDNGVCCGALTHHATLAAACAHTLCAPCVHPCTSCTPNARTALGDDMQFIHIV